MLEHTQTIGAVAEQHVTRLRHPLSSHIKAANDSRSLIARAECAMQNDDRDEVRMLIAEAARKLNGILYETR